MAYFFETQCRCGAVILKFYLSLKLFGQVRRAQGVCFCRISAAWLKIIRPIEMLKITISVTKISKTSRLMLRYWLVNT